MRKRQTFLLTILTPENEETSLCGKIKVISSGEIYTFASAEELYQLIATGMEEEEILHLPSALNRMEKRALPS